MYRARKLLHFFVFFSIFINLFHVSSTVAMTACVGQPASVNWTSDINAVSCGGSASRSECNFSPVAGVSGSKSVSIPGGTPAGVFCTATITCNPGSISQTDTLSYDPSTIWNGSSCVAPANCTLPWGGTLAHGGSVTAYQSSSPAGSCASETRTCNNGSLSGSYTSQTCTAGCTGTPWGDVASGYSNTAYQSSSPTGSCVSETRTCTAGTMSGSYTATSCTAGCAGTPWGDVTSGYSNTAYQSSSPTASCASVSQTRTCTAGSLSGSYTNTSCTSGCTGTPWGDVASGYTATAYQTATVPFGNSCVSQSRTCTGGTLSGSYTYTSCTVDGATCPSENNTQYWGMCSYSFNSGGTQSPGWSTTMGDNDAGYTGSLTRTCGADGTWSNSSGSCTADVCTGTPWGTVSDGYSNTAYQSSTPTGSCASVSQTRTCSAGSMSGSYTNTTCTSGCTGTPWGNVSTGYSNTAYQNGSVPFGSSCVSQTRTCTAGSLSGSYANTSCTVDPPADCTGTPWGTIAHGSSVTAYQNAAPTGSCTSQTRTCTNGTLSGSYTATSCTAGCAGTPWGDVTSGYSNTAYQSSSPTASCASVSQTRTCTAGSLSGSYTNTSCTSGCTGTPWGDVASGYSNTAYSSGTVPAGSSCAPTSQTRTCTGGTLSGSYTSTTCTTIPYHPTITGPATGEPNVIYTFTFQASDDNGDTIHYQIDWDNDGTEDQDLPVGGGFIASGLSRTQDNSWAGPGVKTFQARTIDSNGATSPWQPKTIDIECPSGTYWGITSCLTPAGGLGASKLDPVVNEVFTMDMTANDAAICQIDRRLNGGPWTLNWDTKAPPTYTWDPMTEVTPGIVNYRLTCYENADKTGAISATSTVTLTVTTAPDLTVTNVTPGAATLLVPVTFSTTVSNTGTAGTGASFDTFFQLSNTPGGAGPWSSLSPALSSGALAPGASTIVSYTHTFNTIGAYSVRVCTDKANAGDSGSITEKPNGSAEGNNCSSPWTDINLTSMSGSLNVSPLTCDLAEGESSCPLTFTWETIDPAGVSAVTRNHPDNTIVFTGNNELVGTTTSITGEFPSVNYYLYNSGIPLDGPKTVTTSCDAGGWDTFNGVCANPQITSAYSTGNWYLSPGTLTFSLDKADNYEVRDKVYTDPTSVVVASGTCVYPCTTPINVSVATSGTYPLYALRGNYRNPTSWPIVYNSPPPPTASIALNVYPRTIVKNEKTTVSWDIKYPVATCSLTANVVCTNGMCSAEQTAFNAEVTTILNASSTDTNDPNTSRLITDALQIVAPGYGEPQWRALGKKTFTIRHSTDFTLTCNGIKKETRRVQVAQSSEI